MTGDRRPGAGWPLSVLRLVVLLLAVAVPASATGQLRGRVLSGSQPVPDQPVSLHHVTDAGGTTLGSDTTDAEGAFTFSLASAPTAGVLFVATRYEEQLYIGEPFRTTEAPAEYLVAVGPGATPINLGPAAPPPPAAQPANRDIGTGLAVVAIAGLVLGGGVLLMMRRNVPPGRRLLVDLAELDERHAARPVRDYETRRAALIERLRETA